MFVRSFRSLHARYHASSLGAAFAPRKPRHPLLRVGIGLLGVAVLVLLLGVALVVGTAMIAVGLARRLLARDASMPKHGERVIDGESRVVRKPALPLPG